MKLEHSYLLAPIMLGLFGCQSLNYYDGSPRSNQDVAEVYLTTSEALPIIITEIDNKPDQFMYKKRLYLLPGKHTLKVRTNAYYKLGESPKVWHLGYFNFDVELKAGMTYMFQSDVSSQFFMSSNSSLCIYEEPQDQPNKKTNWTNEYRSPTDRATIIKCDIVTIK